MGLKAVSVPAKKKTNTWSKTMTNRGTTYSNGSSGGSSSSGSSGGTSYTGVHPDIIAKATEIANRQNSSSGGSYSGGGSGTVSNNGTTVKADAYGKAPGGLSVGTDVVTNGGTYRITGVNADGSYKSTKVSDTNSYNYSGVYSNAGSGTSTSVGGQTWQNQTDYGILGQEQMAAGANWQDVLATYNSRYNKAMGTPELNQFANDEIQSAMWDYITNAIEAENTQERNEYIEDWNELFTEEAPTYESQYNPAIDEMLNKILNRDDFSYNAADDPLYQQYQAMYRQEGDRAMQETLANAAASAGGMNSYAITAAQQAGNYYNSQMANKIPELYQLAYEMYLQDKASMVEDLGILQNMDNTQYNRYRDTMSDYYNDKNFAYGMYQDAVNQGNYQQEFDYNRLLNDRNWNYQVGRDTIADNRYENEWNYGVQQDALENKRYEEELALKNEEAAREQAKEQVYALLDLGQMPDASLLQAAGVDTSFATAYLAGVKNQANSSKKSNTSGSSGDSGSSPQGTPVVEDYGTGYDSILLNAREMKTRGYSKDRIVEYLDKQGVKELSDSGYIEILKKLFPDER
ncbi:MAG: hypothetical protein IJN09_03700 [Oscillospiraceae bacterium]|nr:hypothetical protein [Oscillospiraceae bacterium]MBQ6698124.1 hypothetical protein [Oscillospiraceae bacterium]